MSTVIISCSSLKDYIEHAQRKVGTRYPVIYLNRLYHRDPTEMRAHILQALATLDPEVDTVLAAMGFCGGSWQEVQPPCRLVMPRIDDCISLLLQTTDRPMFDLKEPGHLYVKDQDPTRENFHRIFDRMTEDLDENTKKSYHQDWMRHYHEIDIIDTGLNDCRRPDYVNTVRADADWLQADMDIVPGGTYLLEKLFAGRWGEQFLVFNAGQTIERSAYE